jgi:hypothetical protein
MKRLTIRGVRLLLSLLLCCAFPASAAGKPVSYLVKGDLVVFKDPDPAPGPEFVLYEGDKILLWPAEEGSGFQKIRALRYGRKVYGYVREREIKFYASARSRPKPRIGYGGAFMYTRLTQEKEPFATTDEVTYTPGTFTSTAFTPSLVVQFRRENFWRLYFALKEAHFTGTAKTDVSGSTTQDVKIDESFYSLAFEKVWNPWRRRPLYFGFVMEYAHGRSLDLTLGASKVQTESGDIPTFIGFEGVGGANWFLGKAKKFSVFTELRYGAIVNQSPLIWQIEVVGGLLYWP